MPQIPSKYIKEIPVLADYHISEKLPQMQNHHIKGIVIFVLKKKAMLFNLRKNTPNNGIDGSM